MSLPVVVLAGGLATRLRPITETIPKALVPVAERPFIDHQLEQLRSQGFRDVVLCVGYRGEMIEEHLRAHPIAGLTIRCISDWPKLLGTGGAIRQALPLLGGAFLVLYGDSYLLCDFRAVEAAFRSSTMPALMTVFRNDNRWDKSNASFQDGIVLRYDKKDPSEQMQYIDYGLSALRADVLRGYSAGTPFDLADVFSTLAGEGRLAGFEVRERFFEIGSAQGLADTERYLATKGKRA
jgi:N-acetyl-alpha-D-muramate 1-phosphate uridylyltransferase